LAQLLPEQADSPEPLKGDPANAVKQRDSGEGA